MSMTEQEVFVGPVALSQLGIPGGGGSTVPATLVTMYSQRVGGYTQRSTFVTDVEIYELEEGLYFKGPERGEWRSVFADELPQSKVMVTFDPYELSLWGCFPERYQNIFPIAVYVLL